MEKQARIRLGAKLDMALCNKELGWEFTKLFRQICKIFCNFKVLSGSSYSWKIGNL